MFFDYDAKAVAEVMGLEFGRHAAELPAPGFREESRPMLSGFGSSAPGDPEGSLPGKRRHAAPLSPMSVEQAVEQGLPRQALRNVAERIAGSDKAKVSALEWNVVPKTTLERRENKLSPQESERTERVARLFVHARRALGSEDEARAFVTAPHPELDGRSPIEASRTDFGTRRAEQILNALEYGLAL